MYWRNSDIKANVCISQLLRISAVGSFFNLKYVTHCKTFVNGSIIYEHCYYWTSDTCIYWVCIYIVFCILPLTQDWDARQQLKLGVHTQSCHQEPATQSCHQLPATHCWFLEFIYVTDTSCMWKWVIYCSKSVELSHVFCAGLTKIYFWFAMKPFL